VRRSLAAFVAGLLVAGPLAAAPAAPPALERLQSFLTRVQTMRAVFRQQVVSGEKVVEESSGHLVIKRPGRFRFDYEKPYERVVVADGRELRLYEADLDQVTVRPLEKGLGETPAALLTGERDILSRFDVVASWAGEELAWVRLRPRSAESDFESVAIGFRGDVPAELELKDRLGQETRLLLTDVRFNAAVDDKTFVLEVPEGVDVIREGEL
jgi:outer membrane lipoprotein carrier protein